VSGHRNLECGAIYTYSYVPAATGLLAPGVEELAAESSYRRGLVVPYVEDCVQLRILQHVVDLLGRVQQLQLAALGCERK
jgi:hypothetical protein